MNTYAHDQMSYGCRWCGYEEAFHLPDGKCPKPTFILSKWGSGTGIMDKGPETIEDQKCRKCKNKSLRYITRDDGFEIIAFCRLCGHEQ